jgi:uncharacterized protein YbjT (DUF2867 family)
MANIHKAVICGAGFLGTNIARSLLSSTGAIAFRVQPSSRKPDGVYKKLKGEISHPQQEKLLQSVPADVTDPESLRTAFKDASFVVSLVGLMNGTEDDFDRIQWKGASNVARAAQHVGAKLVHISAIGADSTSDIPYFRTKGLGEQAVFEHCPTATVIRPSLVFGPEDDFFNRFKKLSTFLPFLPVFGGGTSRFQPVFVGDIARAVEIISKLDSNAQNGVSGKVIEAGGPEVFTYRQLMEMVLRYSERRRMILSLPYSVGIIQGAVLEQLPQNLFTVTRSQVQQLKQDNVVGVTPQQSSHEVISLEQFFKEQGSPKPTSMHDVLPNYL